MTNRPGGAGAWRWMSIFAIGIVVALPLNAQQIEDIVVTARKREESLQDVPLSITAFSADQLQKRGLRNNYDIAQFTPNFSTVKTVGRRLDRPVIRGMANPSSGGEPNASYFIDGVFVSSSIATAITDALERVEVLRGPQSTQFGRATFSGAVNYITKKPTNDWEGQLNTKAGSDEDYRISAWVSGPIVKDRLAFLFSAAYETYGGEWNNDLDTSVTPPTTSPPPVFVNSAWEDPRVTTDDFSDLGGEKTTDVLAKLTWTPTDATELNFKFGYTKGDDDHWPSFVPPPLDADGNPQPASALNNCFLPGSPEAGPFTPGSFCGTYKSIPDGWNNRINLPDFRLGLTAVDNYFLGASGYPVEWRAAPGVEPGTRRDTYRYLFDFAQGLGEWTVTGRAAYNRDEFFQSFDLDHLESRGLAGLFSFVQDAETTDTSYELRVESPADYRIRGSLGVYYYDAERDNVIRSITGPYVLTGQADNWDRPITVNPKQFGDNTIIQDTTNKAVFGSVFIDLTENWELGIEGRWADDKKTIEGGNSQRDPDFGGAPVTIVGNSVSTKTFTPRFSLNWRPTDTFTGYVTIAKGNKPADWNDQFYRYDIKIDSQEPGFSCPATGTFPNGCGAGTLQGRESGLDLVDEETQWTYEIGVKTSWFDRRVTANLSTFFIDWNNQSIFIVTDIQTVSPNTALTTTIRENAGRTEIFGLELETNWVVNDNLFLLFNYGYNDGEFKEGFDSDLGELQCQTEEELIDPQAACKSIAGHEIPNSPKHQAVVGAVTTTQISAELEAFLRFDFAYETERWISASNTNELGDRKIANLRVGVESRDWTLTGYITNLLDDDTPLAALNFVDFPTTLSNGAVPNFWSLNPQRSRQYGVEFQYRFGEI